jgi:hypothetical protein
MFLTLHPLQLTFPSGSNFIRTKCGPSPVVTQSKPLWRRGRLPERELFNAWFARSPELFGCLHASLSPRSCANVSSVPASATPSLCYFVRTKSLRAPSRWKLTTPARELPKKILLVTPIIPLVTTTPEPKLSLTSPGPNRLSFLPTTQTRNS